MCDVGYRSGREAISALSLIGQWPYLCEACGNRFSLRTRDVPRVRTRDREIAR